MGETPTTADRGLQPTTTLVAYVAHLTVPVLMLLDITVAWHRIGTTTSDVKVLAAGAALWLLIGTIMLVYGPWRAAVLKRAGKPLISFGLFIALAVGFEASYRAIFDHTAHELVLFTPHTISVAKTDPRSMPGVYRNARVSINEIGLRGTTVPARQDAFRIVTVGGSTTICSLLDDTTEWPRVLMDEMNHRERIRRVWTGNAGVDGQTTVHHLALLTTLPILNQSDLLIFMVGANDMQAALASRGNSSQAILENDASLRREEMLGGGNSRNPWLRKLRLYQMMRESLISVENSGSAPGDDLVGWLRNKRLKRAHAHPIALPNLDASLAEYRARIMALATQCSSMHTRCAFVTQPSLYRSDLGPAEQQLLWGGWVGPVEHPDGYISPADAAKTMAGFNQALLQVCREQSLECYDLAEAIVPSTKYLYDDVHFNEEGAQEAADFLADRLLAKSPFALQAGQFHPAGGR
jgi:lysophospholipase L1-like esterase